MKRPSFQFYPGDWAANPNLKRCTFTEKGIWLEVLCLMHDQPEYGVLRWPLNEIAEAVKCKAAELQSLARKGVLKGDDKLLIAPYVYTPRSGRKDGEPVTLVPTQAGPLWYSSRMVKDEYVNTHRGESTRFSAGKGEAPTRAPKPSPTHRQGDGPSTPSSSPPSGLRDSEPVGSADPPGKPLTAKDRVWALGVSLLGESARGLLGKLAKAHGDEALAGVLAEATIDKPIDPKAWVIAACEAKGKPKSKNGHESGGFGPGRTDAEASRNREPRPEWVVQAGFENIWEAENVGCHPHTAHKFRAGKRVDA